MDKYYKQALKQIENNESEEAITTFIAGLDHKCVKCAYGIVQTVINFGSDTIKEDEAISIFGLNYSKIKHLAEKGDTEAMIIVAESIRYGFVDDDDKPYMFWLSKAAMQGDENAVRIMEKIERTVDPYALPTPAEFISKEVAESMDATDTLLTDDKIELDIAEDIEEITEIPEDHAMIDDADFSVFQQFGLGY